MDPGGYFHWHHFLFFFPLRFDQLLNVGHLDALLWFNHNLFSLLTWFLEWTIQWCKSEYWGTFVWPVGLILPNSFAFTGFVSPTARIWRWWLLWHQRRGKSVKIPWPFFDVNVDISVLKQNLLKTNAIVSCSQGDFCNKDYFSKSTYMYPVFKQTKNLEINKSQLWKLTSTSQWPSIVLY